jgi:hypothetical protein
MKVQKKSRLQVILVALGLVLLASAPARAQFRGPSDAREDGYQHGYRDGYEYGRDAHDRNVALDYRTDAYRDGDRGYQSYLGPVELYRDGYRAGYREGAEDGYRSNQSRFEQIYRPRDETYYSDRRWDYQHVASDIGYREGLAAGLKDFREHHPYQPEKHDSWKDADHGYNKSYGSKDEYKRAYRAAYEAGYRDAFGPRR